jgi:hypothetical protein
MQAFKEELQCEDQGATYNESAKTAVKSQTEKEEECHPTQWLAGKKNPPDSIPGQHIRENEQRHCPCARKPDFFSAGALVLKKIGVGLKNPIDEVQGVRQQWYQVTNDGRYAAEKEQSEIQIFPFKRNPVC